MVSAVIFDMDGLLFDSEVYWERARAQYCAAQGCRWTSADEHDVKGMNSREWARLIHGRCGLNLALDDIIAGVTARMRSQYDEHLPLLAGALAAVHACAEHYPLGLASSSPPALIEFALAAAGIRSAFAVIVSSDEVGRGKPDPAVFLETARQLGVVPAQITVFEDSSAGIRAAHDADMRVIAVPNPHFPPSDEALSLADQVLPSLTVFSPEMLDQA